VAVINSTEIKTGPWDSQERAQRQLIDTLEEWLEATKDWPP